MKSSDWRAAFTELVYAYYRATGEIYSPSASFSTMEAVRSAVISDALAAELYRDGMREREIAELFGCSEGTISNRLRRAGVQTRQSGDYPKTEVQRTAARTALDRHRKKGHPNQGTLAMKRKRADARHEFGGHEHKGTQGYIWVYCPEHPRANAAGYVPKHTLVMEREIGRYLTDDEVVHHLNRIRDDNRPENLRLMQKTEHLRMHGKESWEDRRRYKVGRKEREDTPK